MKVGLCTIAYNDKPLEIVFDIAQEIGFDGVEIWGQEPHLGSSSTQKKIKKVREQAKSRGLDIAAYGSYARVLEKDFPELGKTCLRIARDLGAPILRIWPGGSPSQQAGEEEYVQAIQQLNRFLPAAKDSGITIALECHGGGLTDSIQGILRLIHGVSSEVLRVYYQPYYWKDADSPYQLASSIAPFVACIHAQNFDINYKQAFIDSGTVNYKRVVSTLKNAGFDGYVEVEFVAGERKIEDLRVDYASLRKLIENK